MVEDSTISSIEFKVIERCLHACVHGPFFDDWEFFALFGAERATVKELLEDWCNVNLSDGEVLMIVSNALNNLTGYPHGKVGELREYVGFSPEELLSLLRKVRQLKK